MRRCEGCAQEIRMHENETRLGSRQLMGEFLFRVRGVSRPEDAVSRNAVIYIAQVDSRNDATKSVDGPECNWVILKQG